MLHVIVSRGQSNNPKKRALEDQLIEQLDAMAGVRVVITPNLYDLPMQSEGMDALRELEGDLVVLSWSYPRAAHWTLDRCGIRGAEGAVQLIEAVDEDDEDDWEADLAEDTPKERVADQRTPAERNIFCIHLAVSEDAAAFVDEVQRIVKESSAHLLQWLQGEATSEQLDRYLDDRNEPAPLTIAATGGRRWYPVIDFSRCTNCMECIDFCLFGVYGVDGAETILVEQPDNCRKGCPACSRVCPENAILFPQHKSPAIAGSPGATGGLKIDLSELFYGGGGDAVQVAAQERDEQLRLAGREAVGMTIGIPRRQDPDQERPKDDLDSLIDELDELDV
ncbi:MAG: ferredoxin family protein [Planctomycetales bacterium]|nr:ferredoxin family protein [Planctomycetales bacterium]